MADAKDPKLHFVAEHLLDMKVLDKLGLTTFEFHPEGGRGWQGLGQATWDRRRWRQRR